MKNRKKNQRKMRSQKGKIMKKKKMQRNLKNQRIL